MWLYAVYGSMFCKNHIETYKVENMFYLDWNKWNEKTNWKKEKKSILKSTHLKLN